MSDPRTLQYEVVDVFTDRPYAGNPLSVVLGADDLSTEQMQAIARELNHSETAFPVAVTDPAADYRLRIFTPTVEMPFAGHPSVGAAWVLGRLGRVQAGPLVQECGAGLKNLVLTETGARLEGGVTTVGERIPAGPLLEAVGLAEGDWTGVAARVCSTGIGFAYLLLDDAKAVRRASADDAKVRSLRRYGVEAGVSLSFFADGHAHTRVFAAGVGVSEDPATGSAALGFGAYLVASGLADADGTTAYTIAQGAEVGRPSRIEGEVTASGGRAISSSIGGGVAWVARGELAVP